MKNIRIVSGILGIVFAIGAVIMLITAILPELALKPLLITSFTGRLSGSLMLLACSSVFASTAIWLLRGLSLTLTEQKILFKFSLCTSVFFMTSVCWVIFYYLNFVK
jgi:hypothetical protein